MASSSKEMHSEALPEIRDLSPWDFPLEERLDANFLIENEKDGSILVLVPGGKFLAGNPPFEVELPAFYAGLTTVTNAQYARFLTETKPNKTDIEKWKLYSQGYFIRPSSHGYEVYGNKENHPVVRVSWYGAQAYCKWSGLRLPSELEWEKASRFTDGRAYPWGKDWNAALCRNTKNKGKETTSGVFNYPKGTSPWGPYQMSGNVWEWCQDGYDSDAYARYRKGDLTPPSGGYVRVLRGGSWRYDNEDDFRCPKRISSLDPTNRSYDNGFRLFRSLTP